MSLWVKKGVDDYILPWPCCKRNHKKSIFCTIDCRILTIRTSLCLPSIEIHVCPVLSTLSPFWWQAGRRFVMVDAAPPELKRKTSTKTSKFLRRTSRFLRSFSKGSNFCTRDACRILRVEKHLNKTLKNFEGNFEGLQEAHQNSMSCLARVRVLSVVQRLACSAQCSGHHKCTRSGEQKNPLILYNSSRK